VIAVAEHIDEYAFDYFPKKLRELVKRLGYADKRGYRAEKKKSAFGVRLMGDFDRSDSKSDGSNMVDGMMFATEGHSVIDALLETVKVVQSQAMVNTNLSMVRYIRSLFEEPDELKDSDTYKQWHTAMKDTLELTDRQVEGIVKFFDILEEQLFDKQMVGDFIDGVFEHQPQMIMVGDIHSVSSAIGRREGDDLDEMITAKLDESELTDLLKKAVKKEEEE
tara:strand:- start:979 stop:1641 length:663 start_codon:yes stop_codon:yes gene_type:complete